MGYFLIAVNFSYYTHVRYIFAMQSIFILNYINLFFLPNELFYLIMILELSNIYSKVIFYKSLRIVLGTCMSTELLSKFTCIIEEKVLNNLF